MKFEWDNNKNQINIATKGADFADAEELFTNGSLLQIVDNRKNYGEIRYTGYGYVNGRLMNIIFTERIPNIIRLIPFRKANKREVEKYEKNIKN
ncbi:MAG: BrnT family toxin [Gammaproteobacteria bacterium]|nr:BrnT family toxin [Gammaproteobacteria bacterium]